MYFQEKLPKPELPVVPVKGSELEQFISWLETQNPTTRYDWHSLEDCLFCRAAEGLKLEKVDSWWRNFPTISLNDKHTIGASMDNCTKRKTTWNYGAALQRARTVLWEQRVNHYR